MLCWVALPAVALAQNDTNQVQNVVSQCISSIDVSAAGLEAQFSSYTVTTSMAASDSHYQSLQGLTELLLQLGSTLRSTEGANADQNQLGEAFEALSDLFVSLSYYSQIIQGPLGYQLPNLANGALNIVSDVATLPGYGCSQLATWTDVASLYEAASVLSSAWSFNALINSDLGGFCTSVSLTSVDVDGPAGSASGSASATGSNGKESTASQVDVSGSTSSSNQTSSNAAAVLGPQFWSFVLLL